VPAPHCSTMVAWVAPDSYIFSRKADWRITV
jgi:hypothetical protein